MKFRNIWVKDRIPGGKNPLSEPYHKNVIFNVLYIYIFFSEERPQGARPRFEPGGLEGALTNDPRQTPDLTFKVAMEVPQYCYCYNNMALLN